MATVVVTAVDTSVLLPALLAWHANHELAARVMEGLLASAEEAPVVLPAPVLVEAYSVLTRLPAPHRLAPQTAQNLLRESFRDHVKLVSLSARRMWRFVEDLPGNKIYGGATYDAQIAACAVAGGATRLLTFNERDFNHVSPDGLEIVTP